ncbi:MAG: peptidyl-prolyl cis-trans isomerase [Phycisphaerae bacterium]|nr:peptidyl-prolyl cis-trans isomerase [Phycisphaerae bacterium]
MKHVVLIITMLAGGFLVSCTRNGSGGIPITQSMAGNPVLLSGDVDTLAEPTAIDVDAPTDTPATRGQETVAASVMQVNSTFITIDDVMRRKHTEFHALPAALDEANYRQQTQTIVTEGIRELVRQALLYDQAANRLSDDEKEQLDAEIAQARQDMINRAGGSLGKLQEELAAENLTLDAALTDHRKTLVIELYIRWTMQPSIYVSRKMMWDYYQANADEFTAPKRVAMQLIVVDARTLAAADREEAMAAAKQRIQDAQTELHAGAAFDDVAKKYSTDARAADGGHWPLMLQGSHRLSAVEAAAFDLPLGQTSDIIEDGDCLAIVRPANIEPGGKTSFENAQQTIETKLRNEQYRALQDEYYQKLLKTAYIQQNDDFIPRCVQHAMEKYRK